MKKYIDYTAGDFIHDEYFFQWIKQPDTDTDAFWNAFLLSYPQKQPAVAEARQWIVSLAGGDRFSEAEKAALWNRIDAAGTEAPVAVQKSGFRKMAVVLTAAASLLLVAGGMAIWYFIYRTITVYSEVAQKKNITLPDGSALILNSNSSVSYRVHWSSSSPREVWVQGEAFFQVQHLNRNAAYIKPGDRFLVHAGEVDVEVLGTVFNVYARRDSTNVSLNEGRVKLHFTEKQEELVMKPGEMVSYKEDKMSYQKQEVNAGEYSSWTASPNIILNQTLLSDAFRRIEDIYKLTVEVDNPALLHEKLTGELPANDEAQLLKALEKTLQATVVKTNAHHIKIITGK